jgi:insertion element IS1 protein InsB
MRPTAASFPGPGIGGFPKAARKTNHVERFNGTLRQRLSRLVCSTLSFSKKLTHHTGAIRYFICHYNLTRATRCSGQRFR